MPELTSPLRVTWDIPADIQTARALWGKIVDGKPLFIEAHLDFPAVPGFCGFHRELLTLRRVRFGLAADWPTILRVLRECGDDWIGNVSLTLLPPYPERGEFEETVKKAREFSWGLWSTDEGLSDFEKALGFAMEGGGLSVLNPCRPAAPLSGETIEKVVRIWESRGRPGHIPLKIHDLFLSEEMGQNPFSGYPGCAGGQTLAHVDVKGNLLVCRTLPLELGNLLEHSMKELWKSEERARIREELSRLPGECSPCSLASLCRGGCPGLAPGDGRRDGSCKGPRN
ncbi:SPASM domain-containing protein [bacterium]|nr:MAG: SPASM domain-containing protein [bacterium]